MSTTDRTTTGPDRATTEEPRFRTDPAEEDLEAVHDDEITVNGQEIHLNDIRDAMNSHESVLESGVCSIGDAEAGTIPVAFVVLTPEAREEVNATRLPPDDGSQTRSVPGSARWSTPSKHWSPRRSPRKPCRGRSSPCWTCPRTRSTR
ncbi:hypothetical protein [Nesterenkonia pannonica]|uniref:hypothetical protein n=1 Tax=Nesterenkonia pannonica TaxID=1548602 RepID=UPI0021647DCF|nr:hypothetical protein [Nesterenkonia pannonica]